MWESGDEEIAAQWNTSTVHVTAEYRYISDFLAYFLARCVQYLSFLMYCLYMDETVIARKISGSPTATSNSNQVANC